MATKYRVLNLAGINQKLSPFVRKDGEFTRCVNMYTDQVGAKTKRPGYVTLNGTADGNKVNTLFQWIKENDADNFLYRASGSSLYYYDEGSGTGDWTLCANGTIADGNKVGHAVLNDTLLYGHTSGTTRHTTDGTSFTDTTSAPAGQYFATYSQRMYIGGVSGTAVGTSSYVFYSSSGDATDWSLSGTSDSSSFRITGAGNVNSIFQSNDRIVIGKSSGLMSRWDGYGLVQIPTSQGYTSPDSIAEVEGYYIGLNKLGFFGYGGDKPRLISNQIENLIYNNSGSAAAGTAFTGAPAGVDRYLYQCAIGTTTSDAFNYTINDAVAVYNFQFDEWYTYKYANFPTAFLNYTDSSGNQQFAFGDSGGQVYKRSGTATSDNGSPIECILEGYIHANEPEQDKLWTDAWAFANPGCQAQIQVAATDVFDIEKMNWKDIGGLQSGVGKVKGLGRGRFLYFRIHESSVDAPFTFYGFTAKYEDIGE